MVKENKIIDTIDRNDLKGHRVFHFINCVIDTIDMVGAFELKTYILLENCNVNNFHIHSC